MTRKRITEPGTTTEQIADKLVCGNEDLWPGDCPLRDQDAEPCDGYDCEKWAIAVDAANAAIRAGRKRNESMRP